MRWMMMLTVIVVLASVAADPCVASDNEAIKKKLTGALICKDEPLQTFREAARIGNRGFSRGVAAYSWTGGYGEDEMGVIIVEGGISIAGAKTDAMVMSFSAPRDDFAAYVYAEFKGDPGRVIRELKLQEVKSNAKSAGAIGKYVNPLPVKSEQVERGEVEELCPKTIALTPLSKGRFLLGCGWCPG